ncbi:MAG: hypothetical protein JW795_06000 [Chitinivibrionales bacterium]|nr:hypothetical protein [Chitinivibrionales bacterium]
MSAEPVRRIEMVLVLQFGSFDAFMNEISCGEEMIVVPPPTAVNCIPFHKTL